MTRRVTLRDVAERAGVSVTTVSNVVRGWQYISSETRTRVEEAITALGYAPHSIAQGLRTGRTQAIGLIVPDLSSAYFSIMVETIEKAARARGYSVLIFSTHNLPEREAEAIAQVTARWVDGLLMVQSTPAARTEALLATLPMPVVALDRIPPNYGGAWCCVDNRAITRLAVEHLHGLGHTDIALIVAPRDISVVEARAIAFQEYTAGRGRLIPTGDDFDLHGGYAAIVRLLDAGETLPTALFASNDMMAAGAMRALAERGIRVPDDLSIIGVDDVPLCAYLTPALTTVRQPLEPLANAGIALLLALIDEQDADPHITLMPELVVRESTAPPRKES